MQLAQRRPRPLSERECLARLYDGKTSLVRVLFRREPHLFAPAEVSPETVPPSGPTAESPAVHLVIRYPRGRGRMTGEQLRVALEERMQARAA